MKFWLVLACLCLASPLFAQSHPCDAPPQTAATKGSKLGWCHDQKDADGFAITATSFRVSINNVVTNLGVVPALGGPNAGGLYYFEVPLPTQVSRGMYPVWVDAYNAEGSSLPSDTIIWQVGGPPNKPRGPRIVRWLLGGLPTLAALAPSWRSR